MVSREKLRQKLVEMIDKLDQQSLDMLEAGDEVILVFEEPSSKRMMVVELHLALASEPAIEADKDML